jgi:hypothetical protein
VADSLFRHCHTGGSDIHIRAGVLTAGRVKTVESTVVVKDNLIASCLCFSTSVGRIGSVAELEEVIAATSR